MVINFNYNNFFKYALPTVSAVSPPTAGPQSSIMTTPESQRRVHSGPKERTKHLLEERGEGDGSEGAPRIDSRT